MPSAEAMTSAQLLERLRRHYIKPGGMPGGALIHECGINGRFGASSRCDALYVGFTSASGRILVGHELKVSRADWLHELDQIEKADTWADQCHAWYLVVADPAIVRDGELPTGWGLMAPGGRTRTRLQVLKAATVHEDRQPAWWAVRSIMARLDTLMAGQVGDAQRAADAEVAARVQERVELEKAKLGTTLDRESEARLHLLDQFEEAHGVSLTSWSSGTQRVRPTDLARALALLDDLDQVGGGAERWSHLQRAAEALSDASTAVASAQGVLRDLTASEADAG